MRLQGARQEQRRYPRYRVELRATFVTDCLSGMLKIGNLSTGGCKVESRIQLNTVALCRLLIELPGTSGPLKVSQAEVRWVKRNESGMEFIGLDPEDQRSLNRFIGQLNADG